MQKKFFINPEVEIIEFQKEDIVTTSAIVLPGRPRTNSLWEDIDIEG